MPPYLCHICSTHNPHPSPLCRHCTHPYCICCLPVIPSSSSSTFPSSFNVSSSSPLRTAFSNRTPEDEQCEEWLASSNVAEGEGEGEMHPAHRSVMPEGSYDEEGMGSVCGNNVEILKEEGFMAKEEEEEEEEEVEEQERGAESTGQRKEEKQMATMQRLTPSSSQPTALSTAAITIPPPPLAQPTTNPSHITTPQAAPFSFPPWEIPSTTHAHKHSRNKSTTTIDEHKAKLERELKRTMSSQTERMGRLMRKGSMRLREVVLGGGIGAGIGGNGKRERERGMSVGRGSGMEGLIAGLGGV